MLFVMLVLVRVSIFLWFWIQIAIWSRASLQLSFGVTVMLYVISSFLQALFLSKRFGLKDGFGYAGYLRHRFLVDILRVLFPYAGWYLYCGEDENGAEEYQGPYSRNDMFKVRLYRDSRVEPFLFKPKGIVLKINPTHDQYGIGIS